MDALSGTAFPIARRTAPVLSEEIELLLQAERRRTEAVAHRHAVDESPAGTEIKHVKTIPHERHDGAAPVTISFMAGTLKVSEAELLENISNLSGVIRCRNLSDNA